MLLDLLLLALALYGNAALWVTLFNRAHAVIVSPTWTRLTNVVTYSGFFLLPVALVCWYAAATTPPLEQLRAGMPNVPLIYLVFCWCAAVATLPKYWYPRAADRPDVLTANHTIRPDLPADLSGEGPAGRAVEMLGRLPGIQIANLVVQQKTLRLAGLPPQLAGLSIVHLSDFHFTGRIAKRYFEEVVRLANQHDADLVAITGDIVDTETCLPWLDDTLGQLRSRHGVFFVLGNHDLKVETTRLRGRLTELGLIDLGGRWTAVSVRGSQVVLAGNELPWFAPAADLHDAPPRGVAGPLRIVLAHSPDQFGWARRNDADLVLAGHTHGGQVRLPVIGACASASRYGSRYAAGVFFQPPTVLHVSRGLSQAMPPFRLLCPPELAVLELQPNEDEPG